MRLTYNSIFFKIYCLLFAKNIGSDQYGNKYFIKKIFRLKITIEKEDLLFTVVLWRQVKFHRNGMPGFII